MLFSSIIFLFLFLPVVLLIHLVSPNKVRNAVLLIVSLFFYAWGEKSFVLLMVVSITFNYLFGLLINRFSTRSATRITLTCAVIFNIGLLILFKYANFLFDNLNTLLHSAGLRELNLAPIHLPIGISFFTFQALSYVIDVYRRRSSIQKNPINFGLYISLFPQLIAGPIVRYRDIFEQITKRKVRIMDFAEGIRRFIVGLGKKVIIADTMGVVADRVFAIPSDEISTGVSWLGIICYTLQIYFDFSGYSDMAIGLIRMFVFRLLDNFNYPYIAKSIREFWRRWHISLSNWFRDYLYIPLGGSRGKSYRTYFNLIVVFFLCGLWHGASWNFVIWGFFHGVFLVIERIGLERLMSRAWRPIRYTYTLLVVIIGWVIFRSETLLYSISYLKAMFGFGPRTAGKYNLLMYLNFEVTLILLIGIIGSVPVALFIKEYIQKSERRAQKSMSSPIHTFYTTTNVLWLILILLISAMYLSSGTYNPFIYFRF